MDWEKYAWIWNMSEGRADSERRQTNCHIMEDYHKADILKGLR